MSLRILLTSLILTAVAVGNLLPVALCAEDDSSPGVVRFRRVYAPADKIEDWPLDKVRYLPVDPDEFERLVAAGEKAASSGAVSQAHWLKARYSARFDGRKLVEGQAALEMVHLSDDPVLASLAPCGLAINNATWNAAGESSPATLGLDAAGKLQVLVDRSARLDFRWSLRGRGDAGGSVDFHVELPECPNNHLELDLPEGMTPLTDAGIIIEGQALTDRAGEEKRRRWTIELGGHHRFHLQVVPAGAPKQRRQFALLRQATVYDLSLTGLEVSTRLNLEVHGGSLNQVTVAVDPRLRIIGAFYGEQPVPWLRSQPGDGKEATLVLDLPEAASGTARVLRLRAVVPLLTDNPWYLPRIKPRNVFWQEGSITMLVSDSLSANQLETIGCRQSETGPLSAPRRGQSAQFQCFTPDAGLKVVLVRRQAVPQMTSVTEIELGDSGMTGRTAAAFSISEGSYFSLDAELDSRWLVDSVQSLPASAMDDWSLEAINGGKRRLNIHLAKAVSPARPVRVVVTARRFHSPVGRTLGLADLVPLKFVGSGESRRLLAIGTTSGFRMKLQRADQLERLDADALDENEAELFATAPAELLLVNNEAARDLRVSLENRKPSFEGSIRVEADVTDHTLRESYTVSCLPEASGMDRIIVQFSQQRDPPLRWTLQDGTGRQLQARRLGIEGLAAASLPPADETWEVKLPRSSGNLSEDTSFEILGTREVESDFPETVSLASLPEAGSQRATLVIRSLGSKMVRIAKCRLKAIPPEVADTENCQTAPATYRYDPLGDTVAAPEPPLTFVVDEKSPTSAAWVWDCYLDSCYEPLGRARHWVTYRLQNAGRKRMAITLPREATINGVRGVWVDSKPVIWHKAREGERYDLQIDLPSAQQFPTVSVYFTTVGSRLATLGSLNSPFPETDMPVLSRHWTAWLPPGFEPIAPDLRWRYGDSQPRDTQRAGWSRRLFGLLGRDSATGPFDPLSRDAWTQPLESRSQKHSAARKVEQLLQLMGSLAERKRGKGSEGGRAYEEIRWVDLLEHESLESLGIHLLVDHQAMHQLGFTPGAELKQAELPPYSTTSDSMPPLSADISSDDGAAVLQAANLAVLATEHAILLSGRTEASINRADLIPLAKPGTWWVRPGPLAERINEAATRPSPLFLAAKIWCKLPTPRSPHWGRTILPGHEPSDTYGWAAGHVDVSLAAPVRLRFVHRQTMRLFGSITFLFVIALGWWKAVDRPLLLVSLLGIFGVVAMLVPEVYIPLSSAAVLGVLSCLLLGLILRRHVQPPETNTADNAAFPGVDNESGSRGSSSRAPNPSTVTTGIMSVLLVLCGWPAFAQDSPPEQAGKKSPLNSVFIPVDDQRKPTGGKYQIPAELYKQLYNRASAGDEKPQGWLISAATYRGSLSKDTATRRLAVDELKADFDLHVFGRSARVRIPLNQKRSKLLPDGALLDDLVVQPEWDNDGSALLVDVSGPGEYRLELSLRPAILTGGAMSGFDLAMPRLATSRLELAVPTDAPAIEVPSASGVVRWESNPKRLLAELGPSDRLEVRWPETTGGSTTGPDVEAEELLWLSVQPGWVVLDTRFTFKIAGGQVDHLRLLGDQRLRMLPLKGEDAPSVEVRSLADQSKEFQLKWPRPVSGSLVVSAKFLVTGTSAVGNLRLPGLRVADALTARRFLAVSVDANLDHENQVTEGLQQLGVPEFMTLWGEAPSQPKFAYRVVSDQPAWSMPTFPRQSRTTVRQELVISFDRDSAAVRYSAELDTSAGVSFQYRLSVPPHMKVEEVSLQHEGAECVRRWARDKSGAVTIFLNGPTDGLQHLSLLGRLPMDVSKQMSLPNVAVQGGSLESSTLELYRRPSALVEVSRVEGLEPGEAPPFGSRDMELGRLVGSFRNQGDSPGKATLTISANEPAITGRQVTRLLCKGQSCAATVSYQLRIDGGAADRFAVDVPPDWPGPYRLQSSQPATMETVETAGGRRQIVVRPDEAISGRYGFSIAGPLAIAPGSRMAAPLVGLHNRTVLEHVVVLPTLDGTKRIDWETRGLNPCDLPPQVMAAGPADAPLAFELSGETFQATRRAADRKRRQAHVQLADLCMSWQAEGFCSGAAIFYLIPGQSSHCPLWLPEGFQLVNVKVCDVPASPRAESGKTDAWQIPLGPLNLPQRVEVVFTGKLPRSTTFGKQKLLAPRLGNLPVEETLWTVACPPSLNSLSAIEARPVAPWYHELARLRNTSKLIAEASQTATDDQQDTLRWYTRAVRRLVSERTALAHRMAETAETSRIKEDMAAVAQLENEQSEIAARLGLSHVLKRLTVEVLPACDAVESWSSILDRPQEVSRLSFTGGAPVITIAYNGAENGWLSHRLGLASILTTFVIMLGLALHRGLLGEFFCRWPHLVGVMVGIAWWLWLWPSIVGLLIIATSLISLLRSGWKPTRRSRDTIIRTPLETPSNHA